MTQTRKEENNGVQATYRNLWFGIRNLIHQKIHTPVSAALTTPQGEEIAHPGTVLTPVNLSLSTRHPFHGKVQYVDAGLWRDYWRLKFLGKHNRSKYAPHQSIRERQRRLGV